MSRNLLQLSVIHHLEQSGYQYIESLGSGGFADVIAVLTPSKEKVAVKIVQKQNIWDIEDKVWPTLHHPYLLEVIEVHTIKKLDVQLYFMPIMPQALDYTVQGENFKNDVHGLNRIKKWLHQILSALQYLHDSGLCHLDIKSDNVLIDESDDAKLCDFSGLNFNKGPIERFCSPFEFRPPEYFVPYECRNVNGQNFDIWTFGVMAMNILTGHYYQLKINHLKNTDRNWMTQIWPVLAETLNAVNFKYLMTKALPNIHLSVTDIEEARHFLNFILNIRAEERPTASRIKCHPFLKRGCNPFFRNLTECLNKNTNFANPFRRFQNPFDINSHGDIPEPEINRKFVHLKPASTTDSQDCSRGDSKEEHLISEYQVTAEESQSSISENYTVQDDLDKEKKEKKSIGKTIKNLFAKQFNRIFLRKKKHSYSRLIP